MKRLLVNDALTQIPGTRTFWSDLRDWFDMETVEAPYEALAGVADIAADGATLIVRNGTYFGPMETSARVPTISLLQDIIPEGSAREMQITVANSSKAVVFPSAFMKAQYVTKELAEAAYPGRLPVIPLPVDFSLFEPGNSMGLQQALGLPDGCILWIGASQGAAGVVKGWDVFLAVVRANPDLSFVAVFKDAVPETVPPNLRAYARLSHADLVKVIGACKVGLCTSRTESQHLAGIEMGACGLPLVAPSIGTYWKRLMPGYVLDAVAAKEVSAYTESIRRLLQEPHSPDAVRAYWQREFDPAVIRAAWAALIEEVETDGTT